MGFLHMLPRSILDTDKRFDKVYVRDESKLQTWLVGVAPEYWFISGDSWVKPVNRLISGMIFTMLIHVSVHS